MKLRLSCLVLLLAASCGGVKANVLGDPDGGPGDGAPPGDGAGPANLPPLSCGNENVTSIAGTWDIVGASPGRSQSAATLKIDANTFSFAANGKTLSFTASGGTLTLLWTESTRQVPIGAAHTNALVDLGLIPLGLGGDWNFTSTTDTESCAASLGANGFNATCNGVRSTPFGTLSGTLVGQRAQKVASIFGELGGVWHVAASGGGGVDATFSANTFTATLFGTSQNGTLNMKVCQSAASGVTTGGFEFSAARQ